MPKESQQHKIVVLFEVTPTAEGRQRYLELAASLKKLLAEAKGFIRAERFSSLTEEGKLLSMNLWESEDDVDAWRNTLDHRISQMEGRNKLFKKYTITVASVIREYGNTSREQAPSDSNLHLASNTNGCE
ncbi:MAG TPA: antibiotic biosynthesis monooxygenase [Candidatus Mailhella merdigallinarum]|uniref:Antibiotic biosynthesis monooxygenase n=1 Tax=Candidatus Mailhella merdigallinarum TaxID=2838658 RepID=A0A9D2HAY4_9BACT|nr:antibiotic biosynthesis monooxygenase [Candidatus Mailhella merdigallinarum]